MSKPQRNASQEGELESQRQREAIAQKQNREDLIAVINTRQGRRLLYRFIKLCGVFEHGFEPSGQKMAYDKGQRDIGLVILADIKKVSPKALVDMERESLEDGNDTSDEHHG